MGQAGQVSDSLRNLMMRHAHTRTFLRHYLPKRVTVDARAIVHGLPEQRALMRAASRMSRSIDSRRPYELDDAQSRQVDQDPCVVKLTRQRDEMKRQFRGTIESHKGTTLARDCSHIFVHRSSRFSLPPLWWIMTGIVPMHRCV